MTDRAERLRASRLYLVCDQRPDAFLAAVLRGGVDIVQLRIKDATDAEILAAATRWRPVCAAHRALLILNDRPDLAAEADLDGAHVGQDDISVADAREIVGPDRIVGLSTHTPAQVDAAAQGDARTEADYLGIGPVHETPTKPGRPAVGLELVRYAAAHVERPWFAIGGIDAANLRAVLGAGARRIAVVRALTQAPDPDLAATTLRGAIVRGANGGESSVARTGS